MRIHLRDVRLRRVLDSTDICQSVLASFFVRAALGQYDLDTPEWRPLLNPLNNLVYAATGASVRTVLIDGRIVLDEGRLTTLDEQALYARVEELARRQIARAGLPIESKWPVVGA